MPPMVSAQPITAPPCMTPRRLQSSSRTTSSASLRSGERWISLKPISLPKPISCHSVIVVLVSTALVLSNRMARCMLSRLRARQASRGAVRGDERMRLKSTAVAAFAVAVHGRCRRKRSGLRAAVGRAQHLLQARGLLIPHHTGDSVFRERRLLYLQRGAAQVPASYPPSHRRHPPAGAGARLPAL